MARGSTRPATERLYRRPYAWARAKAAFGPGDLGEALARLERRGGCPRLQLAAAVHLFLGLAPAEQDRAVGAYLRSFDRPEEALPPAEAAAFDADFRAAAEKLLHPGPQRPPGNATPP